MGNQKDLVYYFSKFGKGFKKIFSSPKKIVSLPKNENRQASKDAIKTIEPLDLVKTDSSKNPHRLSFGEVYANDLAKNEINKDKPTFPVGSIFVREKNKTATSKTPETVIAMVKREKGFSKNTGDWEFFTFNGKDLQMKKRETVGNCATCHSNAKKTDWVFREYLK